jgi:hypothetical protein
MKHTPIQKGLSRRSFLKATAATLFAGVAITLSGCESEDPVSAPAGDVTGAISSNHGHQAVITKAEIAAGGALLLDIKGSAAHQHSITLSADDITSIQSGARVVKNATLTDDHTHTVTFN